MPSIWLLDAEKFFSLGNWPWAGAGSGPMKLLLSRVRYSRSARFPRFCGMVPSRAFFERSRVFRAVRLSKELGIVPVSAFWFR